jgi:polyisoprenoid-binding protein YceI
MKTVRIISLLTLVLFINFSAMVAGGNPDKEIPVKVVSWTVDPARSTLNWTAKKVGGEHTGTVKIAKGTLNVQNNKLAGGNFAMDMSTIVDTDLTNETFNAKLTNHLKSEDFFSVEKHPTSTFIITKVTPISKAKTGESNYRITGNLTIKGITHSITFPAVVTMSNNSAVASAKFDVDRTKWDIKYRAAIIGTAADKIIDDNFTIDLKIVANKADKIANK